MNKRPIKISPLMWLRLNLLNAIALLTKNEKDEAVFDTAAELTKWASRDKNYRAMREPEDFVDTARDMVNAAKGTKGENKA